MAASLIWGCGLKLAAVSSTSQDGRAFAGCVVDSSTPGAARFSRAACVIRSHCASCHSGEHSAWAQYSQNDFLADGVVASGSRAGSSLYYRLSGSGDVGGGPKNMPKESAPLSSTDLQTIQDWIDKMGDPNT